jgi:DNA polymerase III subunit beta
MDILVNREHLLPVLSRGVAVVDRRQTLPILGNFLIRSGDDQVVVVSTDLELEVRGQCEAQVLCAGEVTVPARKLVDIVRNLPEASEVRLKVSGERCVVTSGRGRYVFGSLPASDFPVAQWDAGRLEVRVEEGAMRRLLEKTWFAMAQQDVRYYLNGLLLEFESGGIRGVATDGHRLSRFDVQCELKLGDERRAVIVPYKAVVELRRQLGYSSSAIGIGVGEKTIQFDCGTFLMTSKLIDGRFPDYHRVIGVQLGRTAVLDRDRLRGALVRAAVLSNEKYKGVRLEFEPGLVRLQSQNPEQEESVEELDVVLDGEGATLGFNVAYLSDVLGVVDVAEVEVRFEDGDTSSIWRGRGVEEETFVVMPMRL